MQICMKYGYLVWGVLKCFDKSRGIKNFEKR
jgi:hypothetical protein